jgi:hypothetical protein
MISGETPLREIMPWQARLSAAYVHPLEGATETVRPDPTGEPLSVTKRPRSYVLAAAGARIVGEDLPSVLSVAAEAVPVSIIPIGFRFGVNNGGEISGGFFYRTTLEFATDLRIDYAVRWFEDPGDVTHHVGLSASF